jgi:hypothetical protein
LGGWVSVAGSETRVVTDTTVTYLAANEKVVVAGTDEVIVKEPKQISTGLARMSAMLVGKTTPDRATMPHSEFPIAPTWCANY